MRNLPERLARAKRMRASIVGGGAGKGGRMSSMRERRRTGVPLVGGMVGATAIALAWLVCALASPQIAAAQQSAPRGLSASAPALTWSPDGWVRFDLSLSAPAPARVARRGAPERIFIDLPDLTWRLDASEVAGLSGAGVRGVRFGYAANGASRVVLDLDAAPSELSHGVAPRADGTAAFSLSFRLDAAAAPAPQRSGPQPRLRPEMLVVAIDPGHGGRDPGAEHGGVREKDITLRFARELRAALIATGRVRAVLTRERDEFVPLAERVSRARARGADIFLSIHADAISDPNVSGASVYTLSDRASDAIAAELAQRENAVDALGDAPIDDAPPVVMSALTDLAQRRARADSERMAEILVTELGGRVAMLPKNPHRQAGFRVLKTFDMPSALIELGFLTNGSDRRRLLDREWRRAAANAITSAVLIFEAAQ